MNTYTLTVNRRFNNQLFTTAVFEQIAAPAVEGLVRNLEAVGPEVEVTVTDAEGYVVKV